MSQENVELLRRANQAFNRGDYDGFLAFCADDLRVEDLNNAPDLPRVARGKEENRAVFAAWIDAFDDFTGEIQEYIDIDDRHVACVVHYSGRQLDTGLEVESTLVDVWQIREDKLVRGTLGYRDREAALDATAQRY